MYNIKPLGIWAVVHIMHLSVAAGKDEKRDRG